MGSIKKKYSRKNNRSNRPRVRRKSMKRKSMKRKSMKRKYKNTRKVRRKRLTGGDGGETFDDKGPLPEGWKTKIVNKRGDVGFEPRRAYYNRDTGQKQWKRPTETSASTGGTPAEQLNLDERVDELNDEIIKILFHAGIDQSEHEELIKTLKPHFASGRKLPKYFVDKIGHENIEQIKDIFEKVFSEIRAKAAKVSSEGDAAGVGEPVDAVPDVDPEVVSYDPKPEIFKQAVGEAGFYDDGENIKDEIGFLPKDWTTIGSGQGRGRIWYDPYGKQHFTRPEVSSGVSREVSREVTSEGSAVSPEVADVAEEVAQEGDAFKETLLKSITEQLKNRITSFPCGTGDCTQDFVKEALDDSDEMLNNALVETIKNI